MTTVYNYDSVGNLLEQVTNGTSEIVLRYSYNKNGYITGETRTEGGKTTESAYVYDALGQLTDFRQSTGYGERYAYDRAGNMTSRVIFGMDGATVALSMRYNEGNKMVSMARGGDKIAYKYDRNGSLTRKTLTSQAYGRLTDAYAYNALDQLTAYEGYDGYRQQFAYDANGMRLSKSEAGNAPRSTLEELLRGNIAGLPEIVKPTQSQTNAADTEVSEELAWAMTEYLYDLTQEYYQVIQETRTDSRGSAMTAYSYGLERIAAYTQDRKSSYVYDGRGSVAQAISMPVAGEKVSAALPVVGVKVQSFSYTAYGEQMGNVKACGFGYNAEAYDAATGMVNLRARQYEPAMNRFNQKDLYPSNPLAALFFNPYLFNYNSPVNMVDSDGLTPNSLNSLLSSIGNTVKKAVGTVGSAVKKAATAIVGEKIVNSVVSHVKSAASVIKKATQPIVNAVSTAWNRTTQVYQTMAQELKAVDPCRPSCKIEKDMIVKKACAALVGDSQTARELAAKLEKLQSYDKYDWLFLTGNDILDAEIPPDIRFAILDILKTKKDITAEDLISLGLYTEETRYNTFFFGLFREDVAGNYAALIELSYRLSRYGTTVWEMSLEEQQMRSAQQLALLYYIGIQASLGSVRAYNEAGSAIRGEGATNAAPGYESVPSDYRSFNLTSPSEQLVDKIMNADRIGSGMKQDVMHRSASYLSKEQLMNGWYYIFKGADGQEYTLLQVEGSLNEKGGIFEYILDGNGYVTHQRFIINGVYTGMPNQ